MYGSIAGYHGYLDERGYTIVVVNTEILNRLREYLESIGDTETTVSAIIANWIDIQKIRDRQEEDKP